jgi:hypothetical protein
MIVNNTAEDLRKLVDQEYVTPENRLFSFELKIRDTNVCLSERRFNRISLWPCQSHVGKKNMDSLWYEHTSIINGKNRKLIFHGIGNILSAKDANSCNDWRCQSTFTNV